MNVVALVIRALAERRIALLDQALGGAVIALGALAALWLVAALIVGSLRILAWLGGIG